MTVLHRSMALAIAAAFVFAGVASAASTLTLYRGAEIHAQMDTTIDSGSARVGDAFTMTVVAPYPSGDATYQNAHIYGIVAKVVHAGQGMKPVLQLQYQRLRLADGSTADISGTTTSAQTKTENKSGARVAATTVGGMIVGNVIGKTIFGAKGGGLIGAAGGFLYGNNYKSNIQLPVGAAVTLTLAQTVVIRRQAQAHH